MLFRQLPTRKCSFKQHFAISQTLGNSDSLARTHYCPSVSTKDVTSNFLEWHSPPAPPLPVGLRPPKLLTLYGTSRINPSILKAAGRPEMGWSGGECLPGSEKFRLLQRWANTCLSSCCFSEVEPRPLSSAGDALLAL